MEAKGIRKWHNVKPTPAQGKVFARNRSCYCMDCLSGDADSCTQGEWVDPWKEVELPIEPSTVVTQQTTEEANQLPGDNFVSIAELADKGSVVAIAADKDPTYDY